MAMVDRGVPTGIANAGAAAFLHNLAGVSPAHALPQVEKGVWLPTVDDFSAEDSLRQQAQGWRAVVDTLNDVVDGWTQVSSTAIDSASKWIREHAYRPTVYFDRHGKVQGCVSDEQIQVLLSNGLAEIAARHPGDEWAQVGHKTRDEAWLSYGHYRGLLDDSGKPKEHGYKITFQGFVQGAESAFMEGWGACASAQPWVDSTRNLHVGASSFQSWYADYAYKTPVGEPKQLARDAYAAGMGDPLVAPKYEIKGDAAATLLREHNDLLTIVGEVVERGLLTQEDQARFRLYLDQPFIEGLNKSQLPSIDVTVSNATGPGDCKFVDITTTLKHGKVVKLSPSHIETLQTALDIANGSLDDAHVALAGYSDGTYARSFLEASLRGARATIDMALRGEPVYRRPDGRQRHLDDVRMMHTKIANQRTELAHKDKALVTLRDRNNILRAEIAALEGRRRVELPAVQDAMAIHKVDAKVATAALDIIDAVRVMGDTDAMLGMTIRHLLVFAVAQDPLRDPARVMRAAQDLGLITVS